MKKLLTAMFVALLIAGGVRVVGDGVGVLQTEASSESNQSSAETPDAKTPQVEEIDLDDHETRKKIIAEAIGEEMIQWRGKEGETLAYTSNQKTPYSGWMKCMDNNGQIRWLFQCKDGKYDGPSTWWYGNGLKSGETTYKNGKKMTVVVWKPNGEKCPVTNFVDGNGVGVSYNDDGTGNSPTTYKDGVKVED